jgi:hypothetical protein
MMQPAGVLAVVNPGNEYVFVRLLVGLLFLYGE